MEEQTEFQKRYWDGLKAEEEEELKKNSEIINSFKEYSAQLGIKPNDIKFKYYQTSGIIAEYPNILSHLNQTLICDKEGLLNFNALSENFTKNRFASGYLFDRLYVLMASPYFRRSFHSINNYAPRFIEMFWGFNDPRIDRYISLDNDNVRINVDDSCYMELDTWYGAKFNGNIENIPDGVVKLRPPSIEDSLISLFFAEAYALDIKWATKNNIKSFQLEEFKTDGIKINKNGNEYHPVRYVHAEFDVEKKNFRHFDGAIHFYTSEEYYTRRDSDFNHNIKNDTHIKTLSQKLFKMNGVINKDIWIEFTSQFLTGNPLVFEYFEGNYPKHITEMLEKVEKNKAQK